jgi:hypothetical protein
MTVRGSDLCRDMGGGWDGLKLSGKTAGKKMPRHLRRLSGPNGPLISEGTRKLLRYATAALWRFGVSRQSAVLFGQLAHGQATTARTN